MRRCAFLRLMVLPACYVEPYDGQVFGYAAQFDVAGYTDDASARVVVEMQNTNGSWTQVASTTSGATPTYSAGAWTNNSPALYWYSTTVSSSVWSWTNGTLRVRNLTEGTTLYGGDVNSTSCFLNTVTRTADFDSVAWGCGFDRNSIWMGIVR